MARNGSVIGNGLKTIFTRIQRTDVLDQLEALGITTRRIKGGRVPVMQVLTDLAKRFSVLSEAEKAFISESVAGVFQINILKSLLVDLAKEQSIYGRAYKQIITQ